MGSTEASPLTHAVIGRRENKGTRGKKRPPPPPIPPHPPSHKHSLAFSKTRKTSKGTSTVTPPPYEHPAHPTHNPPSTPSPFSSSGASTPTHTHRRRRHAHNRGRMRQRSRRVLSDKRTATFTLKCDSQAEEVHRRGQRALGRRHTPLQTQSRLVIRVEEKCWRLF